MSPLQAQCGPSPGTSCIPGLWSRAAPMAGIPPEQRPRCSLSRQSIPTSIHSRVQLALQASSLQTSNDRPPEAATTTLPSAQIPFNTLWWLRVQMVLGGSVGT